jgi:dihydrofolate reductase
MRKITATQFASLDGYMDEPGTWTFPYFSAAISDFKLEELFAAEAMILGRVTYDGFSAAWPAMEDDEAGFGHRMNSMPKYVASRTRHEFDWNATGLTGDFVEAVRDLKDTDGGDLLVAGSSSVFNQLLGAGLVDELRLLVYPVVLRGQLPLFTVPERTNLELTASRTFDTGVLGLTYVPAA